MTTSDETAEVVAAVADLDETARHSFARSAAEMRDRRVTAGDHREARMWNALAALIAAVEDERRATLRALSIDLAGVAVIVADDASGQCDESGPDGIL